MTIQSKIKKMKSMGKLPIAIQLKKINSILDEHPFVPYLLVQRARLIQLLDDDLEDGESLNSVRLNLELATELGYHPDALIELGHFQFAVEDNTKDAIKVFMEAICMTEKYLAEAIEGGIKCYLEINQIHKAKNLLERLKKISPESDRIIDIEKVISEFG